MNKNNYWNSKRDRNTRGGFNRGGRGGNRGWGGNRQGFHNNDRFSGGSWQQGNFGNQNVWKNRPKRETPGKRLSEEDIGVTEYVSQHEGFNGIIKSRYSDFQVSEINEKGEVAMLTNQKPPEPSKEEDIIEDEDLLLTKYNLEILPMDTWDRINTLAVNAEPPEQKVEIDVTGVSKEQRTKIHDAVKKAFSESIVGSTVTIEDKKFVRFEKYRKGVRIDNRVKWSWPAEYVYFVVHKENCDTMDAAVRIAERIGVHMKPSMLGYSGTKDRRAKTSQWFSARRIDPRRIAAAVKQLKDVHIGNFSFSAVNLKLGMLNGNKFRIGLRNVTVDDEVVDKACRHLEERGFINYYGLQRFGSRFDTPTYNIGLKLLKGNYKEAIDAILEEREGPLEQALRVYKQAGAAGAAAAAALLPRRAPAAAHSEARLLRALADFPNDLLGALNTLARNTRLLYLHSYQSLVWNCAVSERFRRFGLTPAVGDLVPLSQIQDDIVEEDDSDSEENQSEADTKQDGDDAQNGGQQDGDSKTESKTDSKTDSTQTETDKNKQKKEKQPPKPKVQVKVLTQEDVDSGRYTIFDIVLPLPGYEIEYPPNMREFYEDMLKKDGLTMELRHKVKSYSMSGAYRHVVVRPFDVSWRCVRYSDPFADLLASDLDQLRGRKLTGILEDGKYKALLLTMSLPASCYATMALRELLKVDTSSDNQAAQNDYHKKKKKVDGAKGDGENGDGMKIDEEKGDGVKIEEEKGDGVKIDEEKGDGVKIKEEMGEAVKSDGEQVGEKKGDEEKTDGEKDQSGEKRKLEGEDEESVKKLKQE